MNNLAVEQVRRGDIYMESPDTLIVNDRELKITEAQRAKVVNFSKLGTGAFKQAFDYVSPNEAVDIANTLLQTEILKDKEVSLLLQGDSLVGITTKPFAFEPAQFIDRIESLKEEFNLTTDNTIVSNGYSTQVSLPKSVKFDADVYSPGLNFTYDINGIYAHLALNRLICSNGMITKTRTSSINIMNETSLERVQALLRDVQSNPDMVYASVIEDLQKAARTPASLMDLKQFKNHFSTHFGDDKAEERFLKLKEPWVYSEKFLKILQRYGWKQHDYQSLCLSFTTLVPS